MSDKTCGNCGHSMIGDCVAGEYRTAHLNSVTDCGDWFSLEQRYEQLEQVAKKLYMHAKFVHMRTGFEIDCIVMRHAKRELEALGVSMDD